MLDSAVLEKKGTTAPASSTDGVPLLAAPEVLQSEVIQEAKMKSLKDGCDEPHPPGTECMQRNASVIDEADPTEKFLNDDDQITTFEGDMGQALEDEHDEDDDDEEPEESDEPTSFFESDPASQRNSLLARLKVVEAMLQQVAAEEKLRALREGPVVKPGANHTVISSSPSVFESGSDQKRQRRPNPKYFDSDIEAEFEIPGTSSPKARASYGEEGPGTLNIPLNIDDGGSATAATAANTGRPVYSNLTRPPMIQRARTALAQKHRVFSLSEIPTATVKADSNLDNLSIRELHEAYRSAFGRDTSVKDKHWLKRQIFMGLSKQNSISNGKENNASSDSNLKGRVGKTSTAGAPLSASGTVGVNGKRKCKGSEVSYGPHECKRAHRKTLSLACLSPSTTPNPSTAGNLGGLSTQVGGLNQVQNSGSALHGKRVRKPNRRYIEDEAAESLGIGSNGSRTILSTFSDAGKGNKTTSLSLSWKSDTENVETEVKNGILRSTTFRASTRSANPTGRRSKHGNNGMKKKLDARAAKLVKMAHSARVARHDVQRTVRKVKFRLPAGPGQEKGEVLNGGDGEQVSCLLPNLIDGSIGDHEMLSSQFQSRSEENDDQAVVTVPTANGGTRRKHHRPWTLREVLTLVEGVARCGGGKWADIKKLAFSTVSYRTAVDLKDKWRNLLRASRAQLHPPKQGETRKKQFSAAIPSQLLARVRELAALNNQAVSSVNAGSSTSRSGRVVHRR